MSDEPVERTFWLDNEASGVGGVFIRTELGPFFARMRAQGMEPVGVSIENDDRNTQVLYREIPRP